MNRGTGQHLEEAAENKVSPLSFVYRGPYARSPRIVLIIRCFSRQPVRGSYGCIREAHKVA